MSRVISVANQKGGVGKTAVAVNLAACLSSRGHNVLLIDMDPQGSATASLGFEEPDEMEDTLSDVFNRYIEDEDVEPDYGIIHISEAFDLMPGNIDLAAMEVTLVNQMNRERILRDYVAMERLFYDFIIIDCSPSLGMLTINALAASDSVIIPVQPAYLPVKGLQQLFKSIAKIRKFINPDLNIEGILISMIDYRSTYEKDIVTKVRENFESKIKVFETQIPLSVRVAESTAEGISIYKHDPKGKAAMAFENFTEEVLL